jgi:chromosome segregation protein
MYLKKLEIHGFKSFAHKTVLEFDPGITAVVGPNGSGKSNVADSIRWVMGEQSMKLLRGKKSEDVIFAGSDKKSKLSMAEVVLTFDNRDKKLPFEYSEVAMARRLYRNGESEYLVNNQRVRLLDVVDALVRSGFGAANYTVVGQGTIDQMVLAGPAEIKQLVEEASGVKPYYLKRDKTVRRLEQTEENLSKVDALIAEIEPRLRSLKRQAKRMEEREKITQELSGLQIKFFGREIFLQTMQQKGLVGRIDLKNNEIKSLDGETAKFQAVLEKEERRGKSSTQFISDLENKISHLQETRLRLQEQLAEIRGKLKSDLIPGKTDPESLRVQKLDLERQIETVKERLKSLMLELSENEKVYNSLKSKVDTLSAQLESARNSNFDVRKLKSIFLDFEQDFSNTLNLLTFENIEIIKEKLTSLVSKFVHYRFENDASQNIEALLEEKDGLVEQMHELELRLVELRTIRKSSQEQLDQLSFRLDQIKSAFPSAEGAGKNELFVKESQINKESTDIQNQSAELQATLSKIRIEEKDKKNFLVLEEKKYRERSFHLSTLKDELSQLQIEKTKVDMILETLRKEAQEALKDRFVELVNYKGEELEADIGARINRLKHSLELAGGVDEATMQEFRETQERFEYLSTQSHDLKKAVEDLRNIIKELDEIIKRQFDTAFENISSRFSEYFRILFNGGRATMTLIKSETSEGVLTGEQEVDDEDEDEEGMIIDGLVAKKSRSEITGIEIRATPPGKKLSSIAALSGGERALTSIALLCSMLAAYPSPFVVLDEVDAALDEANSIRFAKILETLSHQTQFVTITHNRETMRQAHTLYGVTMGDDSISKILSIKLEKAQEIAE